MSEKIGWTTKVLLKIIPIDITGYEASSIAELSSGTITLNMVRNVTRHTASPKIIIDTIYYPNADAADQPHRHTIRLSMPSNHAYSNLLEKLQDGDYFFNLMIEDTAEKWKMTPVTFDHCKVVDSGEDIVADDAIFIEYELIALGKTVGVGT
jgi:hypothetical protein